MPLKPRNNSRKVREEGNSRAGSYAVVVNVVELLLRVVQLEMDEKVLIIAVYVAGLLSQTNITMTAIAENVGVVTHDQLNWMLNNLSIKLSWAAVRGVKLVETLGLEGALIIDDVLLPKPFSKAIAYCGWDWDHSSKRNVYGQRLVFIVWRSDYLIIPLLFAIWQKDPHKTPRAKNKGRGRKRKRGRKIIDHSARALKRRRTYQLKRQQQQKAKLRRKRLTNGVHVRSKNELARIMVWKLVRAGIKSKYVLFDNWYGSKHNVLLFERLKLYWVTRSKENSKVNCTKEIENQQLKPTELNVKQLGETIPKAHYHYYAKLGARLRSFVVIMSCRPVLLTVIKDDRSQEAGTTKYLLTNALWLTNQQVVAWYRKRWAIEVFFRDAKQHLGLTKCQARTPQAIINHIFLVCLAYMILQLLKPLTPQPRPSIKHSQYAIACLLVFVQHNRRQLVRPLSDGSFSPISLLSLLSPARTRLKLLEHPLSSFVSYS